MERKFHYCLLLVLLSFIAVVQIISGVAAVQLAARYERLAVLALAQDGHSENSAFHIFFQRAIEMCRETLVSGVITILLCIGVIWVLRRWTQESLSDDDTSDDVIQSANVKAVKASKASLTQPRAKSVEALATAGSKVPDKDDMSSALYNLVHKSQHDSLTGLPNRSLAMDRLKQVLARAERHRTSFAVLFIDLNGFKLLNDTQGHEFGDKVLRKTAERLSRSVRALDTVSRLGGDEFLVVLDQVDAAVALETAQTLRTIVSQPVLSVHGPVSVGMSAGIAIFPEHGRSVRQLVRAADAAMYLSKRASGQPKFALEAGTADAPIAGRNFETTTTTVSVRLLETWTGKLRDLKPTKT